METLIRLRSLSKTPGVIRRMSLNTLDKVLLFSQSLTQVDLYLSDFFIFLLLTIIAIATAATAVLATRCPWFGYKKISDVNLLN